MFMYTQTHTHTTAHTRGGKGLVEVEASVPWLPTLRSSTFYSAFVQGLQTGTFY
jgi:hypothetical protein